MLNNKKILNNDYKNLIAECNDLLSHLHRKLENTSRFNTKIIYELEDGIFYFNAILDFLETLKNKHEIFEFMSKKYLHYTELYRDDSTRKFFGKF